MKKVIQSKTFWINALTLTIAILGSIAYPPALPVIAILTPPLNIALRFITKEGVGWAVKP